MWPILKEIFLIRVIEAAKFSQKNRKDEEKNNIVNFNYELLVLKSQKVT